MLYCSWNNKSKKNETKKDITNQNNETRNETKKKRYQIRTMKLKMKPKPKRTPKTKKQIRTMKPMPPMMTPTDSWSSVVKWTQSMVPTVAHMGCIFASPGALLTNIRTLVHYSMQLSSVICNKLYPFSPQGYLPQQGWRVYREI